GERRCLQFVIGLKDQRDIHDVGVEFVRQLALEHVKKVGGDIEIGVWFDWSFAVASAVDRGDDCGKPRGKARRNSDACFAREIASLLIKECQRRYRRA